MYVVGMAVLLWFGSERVRVWLERSVDRVLVSGRGRLRVLQAEKPMMKIGRAMSMRNSAAVMVRAIGLCEWLQGSRSQRLLQKVLLGFKTCIRDVLD